MREVHRPPGRVRIRHQGFGNSEERVQSLVKLSRRTVFVEENAECCGDRSISSCNCGACAEVDSRGVSCSAVLESVNSTSLFAQIYVLALPWVSRGRQAASRHGNLN